MPKLIVVTHSRTLLNRDSIFAMDGVAMSAEVFDPHPDVIGATIFTGRFDIHRESPDGRSYRPGPDRVSAEEAIAWGRAHADVVLIRVGQNTYYSAGSSDPEGDEDGQLPRWPEGMRVGLRFGWFNPPEGD